MADPAIVALAGLRAGRPTAMVAVLAHEGSAPRGAGARMFVTAEAIHGTIGGGNLEHQLIRQARAILDQPVGAWRVQDYPLGPLLGQCCGGRVRVLVEHLEAGQADWMSADTAVEARFGRDRIERRDAADCEPVALSARGPAPLPGDRMIEPTPAERTPLALFGAGHVGQALVRLLPGLPFLLDWRDNRSDLAGLEGLRIFEPDSLVEAAHAATGAVVILTHDHALDYRLTASALQGSADFIGLIGSATKRARFLSRLRKQGFDEATLGRLTCPIGLPEIRGKQPEVIAVAIAAQLLVRFPPRSP